MNADDHVREELGAYALGALDPADRRSVEAHLAGCATCRDELAHLSAVTPLLDRLRPEEATADLAAVRSGLVDRTRAMADGEHARLRRRLRRWRGVAVAASVVALVSVGVAWDPLADPPDRVVGIVVPVAADAADVRGTVAAYAWEWGSTIELRVEDLPPRTAYLVWAVAEDGTRQRAGTWGPTAEGSATVRAASAILRPRLATVEVTDPAGTPLFAVEFPSP